MYFFVAKIGNCQVQKEVGIHTFSECAIFVSMTLDLLKSEALKLGKSELFDFAQFIIGALKEKDSQTAFHLSRAQTEELAQRLKDVQDKPSAFVSGVKAEEDLISKYGLDV